MSVPVNNGGVKATSPHLKEGPPRRKLSVSSVPTKRRLIRSRSFDQVTDNPLPKLLSPKNDADNPKPIAGAKQTDGGRVSFIDQVREKQSVFKKTRNDTPPPQIPSTIIKSQEETALAPTKLKGKTKRTVNSLVKECVVYTRERGFARVLKTYVTEAFHREIFLKNYEAFFTNSQNLNLEALEKTAEVVFEELLKEDILLKDLRSSLTRFHKKLGEANIRFPSEFDQLLERLSPQEFVSVLKSIPSKYREFIEQIVGGKLVIRKIKKWGTLDEVRSRLASLAIDLLKIKRDFEKGSPFTFDNDNPIRSLNYQEVLDNWFRGGRPNLDKLYVQGQELEFYWITEEASNHEKELCQKKNLKLLLEALDCRSANDNALHVKNFFEACQEICLIPELKMQGIEPSDVIEKHVRAYFEAYTKNLFKVRPTIQPIYQRPLDLNNLNIGAFKKGKEGLQFTQTKAFILHLPCRKDAPGVPIGYFTLQWTLQLSATGKRLSIISTDCSPLHLWHGSELSAPEKLDDSNQSGGEKEKGKD